MAKPRANLGRYVCRQTIFVKPQGAASRGTRSRPGSTRLFADNAAKVWATVGTAERRRPETCHASGAAVAGSRPPRRPLSVPAYSEPEERKPEERGSGEAVGALRLEWRFWIWRRWRPAAGLPVPRVIRRARRILLYKVFDTLTDALFWTRCAAFLNFFTR
jgi:hypothetical protein